MQKNWYAVYTRPHHEKKVSLLLTKKRIENFCPVNTMKIKSFRRNKFLKDPLFTSYVFVYACKDELESIKQTYNVISLLYWMGKPAVIKDEEIEAIKEFSLSYQNIELKRTQVDTNDIMRIIDGPEYSIDGKIFALKHKVIKVNLPSLGYIMIAKIKDESIFAGETTILQNNSFSHS